VKIWIYESKKILQYAALGAVTPRLLESCTPSAKSETKHELMQETYLQQSPDNLKQIEHLAGKSKSTLEEFLHTYRGEVYFTYADRSNPNKQVSQGFLPSPQKIGENDKNSIIQLPEKKIVIVGIIKELDKTPQIIILESFQRHSVYSIVDRSGNYIRDNNNWDHPKIVEIPNDSKSIKAETYHSVLIPVKNLRDVAQYSSYNSANGGQIVNNLPKPGHILQSYQEQNVKEGVLLQGGSGIVSQLELKKS
jgi:hypothetical protein